MTTPVAAASRLAALSMIVTGSDLPSFCCAKFANADAAEKLEKAETVHAPMLMAL